MTNLVAACLTDCTSEWLAVHSEWLNDSVVELLDHWPFLIDLITQHLSYSLKPQSCIRQLLYNFFYPLQKSLLRVLGSLKRQDKTGFTSYVEMENYFFFENIYLDRTKDFAKKINCSCHKKHSQMTTLRSFAHNLANQKNWFSFLASYRFRLCQQEIWVQNYLWLPCLLFMWLT